MRKIVITLILSLMILPLSALDDEKTLLNKKIEHSLEVMRSFISGNYKTICRGLELKYDEDSLIYRQEVTDDVIDVSNRALEVKFDSFGSIEIWYSGTGYAFSNSRTSAKVNSFSKISVVPQSYKLSYTGNDLRQYNIVEVVNGMKGKYIQLFEVQLDELGRVVKLTEDRRTLEGSRDKVFPYKSSERVYDYSSDNKLVLTVNYYNQKDVKSEKQYVSSHKRVLEKVTDLESKEMQGEGSVSIKRYNEQKQLLFSFYRSNSSENWNGYEYVSKYDELGNMIEQVNKRFLQGKQSQKEIITYGPTKNWARYYDENDILIKEEQVNK